MIKVRLYVFIVSVAVLVAACGGGGSSAGNAAPDPTCKIGGMITGLAGSALVLQNNGADDLPISADGAFTFSKSLAIGSKYAVTIKSQPTSPSQTCTASLPSGTVANAAITNIAIECETNRYEIGGNVSGLTGMGLVLANNGADQLSINANGSFSFASLVRSGDGYSVTIIAQPTGPAQNCEVTNSAATVTSSNVVSVQVNCTNNSITLLAGQLGGLGNVDGVGANARFNFPFGIAVDSTGNVFVADRVNQLIRKINPAGVVTTLAGVRGIYGALDGPGDTATFNAPTSVAVDALGNVFVADGLNDTIRKITASGIVSTFAGIPGHASFNDGPGAAALFNDPMGVAADAQGNVYVADAGNAAIRMITSAGVVSTYAGMPGNHGDSDGTGAAARFFFPDSVASDRQGNLYVVDSELHNLRKIAPGAVVTTLAGGDGVPGSMDGVGAVARFNNPAGVTADPIGNAYVADFSNNTIRQSTSAGVVTTLAGTAGMRGTADGNGAAARFNAPGAVAADSTGNIYVGDTYNHTIRKISASGAVTTIAGRSTSAGAADGTKGNAQFSAPQAVAADLAGNVYVADTGNYTIRLINSAGVVSTLAGLPGGLGAVNGTGSAARFGGIYGIDVDSAGNVYVADATNNIIRTVTATGVVKTLAGTVGVAGANDGPAKSARFSAPLAVAVDASGNVYVADALNRTIRKIDSAGMVTTLAGSAGLRGQVDGTGKAARFDLPGGLATDSGGNVYVADIGNNAIRKVTPAGVVTTIAAPLFAHVTSDVPFTASLAVDADDSIYVADATNSTIRKITKNGVISTVVGSPNSQGVILGPLPGSLGQPLSIAFLPGTTKRLVEADSENAILIIDVP